MLEEFNWHLENRTWSLVELPVEEKAPGSIEQYKACMVVLGNFQ